MPERRPRSAPGAALRALASAVGPALVLSIMMLLGSSLAPARAQTGAPGGMASGSTPAPTPAKPPAGVATATREAQPMAADPALEARVMKVAEELRCLVCQNETIAASQADLAVDLRKQIRLKLREGQTERQILDFMVERYGDFVLYRPPLKATTVMLWAGPFVLLLVAAGVLLHTIRRRRTVADNAELTPAQAQRARELLAGNPQEGARRT